MTSKEATHSQTQKHDIHCYLVADGPYRTIASVVRIGLKYSWHFVV